MIDAYRIGVSMALTNNVSGVIGVIAKDVLGLHGHVKQTELAFTRMKIAIAGAAGVLGSAAVLGTLKHLASAAMDYKEALSKLHGMGFSEDQIRKADDTAFKTATSTPGVNATEAVKLQGELVEIVKTPEAAAAILSMVEQFSIAMQSQFHLSGEEAVKQSMKAVEMTLSEKMWKKDGTIDPDKMKAGLDNFYRFLAATNGFVDPRAAVGMVQQSGVAAEMMDNKEYWQNMAFRAMQQGGLRAGTGLAAEFRTLSNGPQGLSRGVEWEKLKLGRLVGHGHERHFELSKEGRATAEGKGGYDEWQQKFLVPALLKAGHFKTEHDEGFSQYFRGWVQRNFSTETARRAASVNANPDSVAASKALFNKVPGFEENYKYQQENNPALKMKAFEEAWTNLQKALGMPMVDDATNMLKKITIEVNRFAQWSKDNKDIVGGIEAIAAAFAVVIGLGGSIAIASVALGPFVTGFRGLLGVMGGGQMAQATAASATLGGPRGMAGSLLGVAFGLTALVGAAYGLHELLKVGDKIESNGFDQIRKLFGETPEQRDQNHAFKEQVMKAVDNFSIFDRSTWKDPKSSIWSASPKDMPTPPPTTKYEGSPLDTFLKGAFERITGSNNNGAPVHVIIDNPGAVSASTASALSNALTRPATGASGPDNRVSPPMAAGHPQ